MIDIVELLITASYKLFSRAHAHQHVLGHKTHVNKSKEPEIRQCIFFNHIGIKLKINSNKLSMKVLCIWKVNNAVLNSLCTKEEINKEKIF